jgi:hypothetical protein
MKDHGRLVALEDAPHAPAVRHVGEHWDARGEVTLVDELTLDLEERRLALFDQHEPRGAGTGDLAAELGADRAAGAGDEHGLALEVLRDRLEVDVHRFAAEHVLHLHRPDATREVLLVRDQLVEARQRLDGDPLAAGDLHHLLTILTGG